MHNPIETAPRDGTLVRLLVEFTEHNIEDSIEPSWTIGACIDDNVGEDERIGWQFAGWCWSHDHFTEGKGNVIGWLPMIDEEKSNVNRQWVADQFDFLEGLVNEHTYWEIVDKVMKLLPVTQTATEITANDSALNDPDRGWIPNAQYLLDHSPYAVRVREGGGPECLVSSLVATFLKMQHQLMAYEKRIK